MSVTVAEEGNRRKGEATSAEVEQYILDISSWFKRSGCRCDEKASSADIQKLEKTVDCRIPSAMRALLAEMNGGGYLYDKEICNCDKIAEIYSNMEGTKKWKQGLLPLAGDETSLLVLDTTSGEVLEWDEDDGVGDVVQNGSSLARFLESYAAFLLGGGSEFVSGMGVIEKVGASKSRK